jgi:hypothetical protein
VSYFDEELNSRKLFEVCFAHCAVRAQPIIGHVFPAGARSQARARVAECFVVDVTADKANELFVWSVQ